MDKRKELHLKLKEIVPLVHFQPPASVQLSYPCIIYTLTDMNSSFANNKTYSINTAYTITVITKDPDQLQVFTKTILNTFPSSRFVNSFINDNLNHTILQVYYG